ncbi:hypothetical protein [Rickettsiella endosymbiont of Dermanyssus gallinae]|uniref:hypothetical protein n=1 Tax=Rickettsiella endosymbiont of Dermanyssus gallinae TaxID=2856608 RepID=UPI001C52BB82|nr:hypothetical protein [Rickettsiella endosymbiont of Dermanyssus gallinae]
MDTLSPELADIISKIGANSEISEKVQQALLAIIDWACDEALKKENWRIARCLLEEGLSSEQIQHITGYCIEEFSPTIH